MPLSFPHLTSGELTLRNQAATRDGVFSFTLGVHRWSLRFPVQAVVEAWIGVVVQVGSESLWIGLSPSWANQLLGAWLNASPAPPLTSRIRCLYLEMLLADWLDSGEFTVGEPIEVAEIQPSPATPPPGLSLPLQWLSENGLSAPGLLVCSTRLVPQFTTWMARLSPAPPMTWCETLPFCLGLRLGTTLLTLTESRDIETGDIIRIEHALDHAGNRGLLTLHGRAWPVRRQSDSTFEILELPMTLSPSHASATPLDDLPVSLIFEAGEKTMTLGELQTLRPGYTFALDRPLEAPVNIRANGQPVGQGELVDLDGRLGVRVLSWAGNRG